MAEQRGEQEAAAGGDVRAVPVAGATVGTRYRLVSPIGRGGMGAVFAGVDTVLDRPVAIKLLSISTSDGGRAGSRLLDEARTMARVSHPSCVQVFDRGSDPRLGAYVVMERLDGEDLARYLRARGPLPAALAMSLMDQICEALAAIHDAGIVHRDLKPANVFVLRHAHGSLPRIKILDFGIALTNDSQPQPSHGAPGTLPYMAPESWRDGWVPDVRSDVYALGAIFYELLTASAPFRGDSRAALRLAILNDSPDPLRERRRDLPEHLIAAINRALDKQPAARHQDVAAFGRALGVRRTSGPWASGRAAERPPPSPGDDQNEIRPVTGTGNAGVAFVGRQDTLGALEHALGETAAGMPQMILIEGESGLGKTAVLDRFRHLRGQQALFLSGRAREGDSISFPALGQAIDDLVAHLLRLSPGALPALLPKNIGRATRIFPALARVPAVLHQTEQIDAGAGGDPLASRLEAFDAVRALFGRLAEHQAVVLLIDDLQWLDSDSTALIAHLLAGHTPPAILLVGAIRSSSRQTPIDLGRINIVSPQHVRTIRLGPLSHEEACALIRARWQGPRPLDPKAVGILAEQAGGVPFLCELLASALFGDREPSNVGLDDVILQRSRALPPEAQAALALICISSSPPLEKVILDVVGGDAGRALEPLHACSFIRSQQTAAGRVLEPYHDRIRGPIRGSLSPDERRELHRRLAARLTLDPDVAPEILAEHVSGGGDKEAAFDVAVAAARSADGHLAFDRAAALFSLASSYSPDAARRLGVLQRQATALERAGRRNEAGTVLLEGAALADDAATAINLRHRAGTDFLLSGQIDRGLEILTPFLEEMGLTVPRSFESTVQATMEALGALAARGVVPGSCETLELARLLERTDLCSVVAQGLAHIDLRVLPFACQALMAALDAGEPHRLQRACALFVINTVEYFPNPLVDPVLELCRVLTGKIDTPIARALLEMAVAEHAHFSSDFLAAEAAFERAERILLGSCPGATRELATARDIAVFIQYAQKGDFQTQLERTERWLAEAEAAHDVFHTSMLRVAHAIVWIAHDQPERARSELQRAQSAWAGEAGVLEVAAALYHDIIDRYQENDLGPAGAEGLRSSLLRSPAAQTPFLGGYLGLQSVWASLRALADGRMATAEAPTVRAAIEQVRLLELPIWLAVSEALAANLDYLMGQTEKAIAGLESAEQRFRRLHMLCLAACARKRRGQFVSGELGARMEQDADGDLRSLGVEKPDRWARAYWSMFDVRTAQLRTYDTSTNSDLLSGPGTTVRSA